MRKGALAVAAAVAMTMVWSAAPAQAQQVCSAKKAKKRGLGRLMTGLRGSVEGALRGDGDLGSDLAGTAAASAEAASVCLPPDASEAQPRAVERRSAAERPAPRKAKAKAEADALAYPSRMPIPQEWKAAKQAYDEFGKVKCFGCEGGFAYSGWPDWPRDEHDGKYGGGETRLSKLPVGHVHRWLSNGFNGTLTVNAEEEHHGFKCRRMTYRLEKDGRNAERPSLICWGKMNEYAGSDSWVGVF